MRKPGERRWTVMVVPHGSGVSRAVELQQTVVKAVVGISSVLVVLVLVLGSAAIARGVNITRSGALEHENRLLADEIGRMREKLDGLRDTLNRFSQQEEELRLLAGLTPTDPSVQQAGIGGPQGAWPERGSLAARGNAGQQGLPARGDVGATIRRPGLPGKAGGGADDPLPSPQTRFAPRPPVHPT